MFGIMIFFFRFLGLAFRIILSYFKARDANVASDVNGRKINE